MPEHFNNVSLFTSVGKKIQGNISTTKNNLKKYLKTRNPNKFILSLTTSEGISDIIQKLKLEKRIGFYSLSLKV